MAGLAMLLLGGLPAHADLLVTGTGTSATGNPMEASAKFSFNSGTDTLTIVLTNLEVMPSTSNTATGADILTAMTFNNTPTVNGLPGPNGVVNLTSGSVVETCHSATSCTASSVGSSVLGTYWQYSQSLGGVGVSRGFGNHGNLCGSASCTPVTGSNVTYGLAWANYPTNGNFAGMSPLVDTPLIKNSATFTLKLAGNFNLSSITTVSFLYGTSSSEGTITCTEGMSCTFVPEPSSLLVLGPVLAGLPLLRRRKR